MNASLPSFNVNRREGRPPSNHGALPRWDAARRRHPTKPPKLSLEILGEKGLGFGKAWTKSLGGRLYSAASAPSQGRCADRVDVDGRSRPEMAPQRLEKIESAPGNGWARKPRTHKMGYTGAG